MVNIAYLGLGSNIGDRLGYIRFAYRCIKASPHIAVLESSPVYRTKPVGVTKQPYFFNAVIKIETSYTPIDILHYAKWVESSIGRRQPAERWGPREIDIDILTYSDTKLSSSVLALPHKELYNRFFWLESLSSMEKNGRDPYSGALWRKLACGLKRTKNDCVKIYPAIYLYHGKNNR